MNQEVLKKMVHKSMTNQRYYIDDVEPYFNDVETFLKFVIKNGGFKHVMETAYGNPSSVIKNVPWGFWDVMLKLNPETTLKMIADLYFTDVDYEGDEFFYVFKRYNSLSQFFAQPDKEVILDLIEKRPVDESTLKYFVEDFSYEDIINALTFENKLVLGEYIINKVGNEELFLDDFQTVVFQDISFKQKNEDTFILSEKNIMDVIEDPDSLKIIIEKYTPELIDKLYQILLIAVKNVLHSENLEFLLLSLSSIFAGDIFEEGGALNIKIRNFKSLVSVPEIGGGSMNHTLERRRYLNDYYKEYFGGLHIEDTPNLDFYIIDEINDIFENNLV